LKQTKSGENKLILSYPTSWWKNMWREALPSGNGKIGASVYGGIKNETILMNHGDLWHLGIKDDVPDVSHTLQETRDLMSDKKYLEASWHLTNALKDKEYNTQLAASLPLGALNLSMPSESAFRNYHRTLDMETGEVTVEWDEEDKSYYRKLFVSREDDLIAYEIGTEIGSVEGEVHVTLQKSDDGKLAERYPHLTDTLEVHADESYFYYAAQNDDGTDFGAVLRIIPTGGHTKNKNNRIQFMDSEKVLILVKVFIKGEREEEWKRLKSELEEIHMGYEQLIERHINIHKPLLHSSSIELEHEEDSLSNEELLLKAYSGEVPISLIQKMWSYGRYLFISGTSVNDQPFGLYGLWYGDYNLIWSHHMANENIQMMYWHAGVGGLIEQVPALFNYYDSMMNDFRNNAKKLYGCRGIFIPAGTTPGIGVPNQVVPVIMNWTGAAGWLAKHYYDYYLFTGNHAFLKEKALPFMREVALFYEDFLVVGEYGYYKFFPSVSPENTPENFMPEDGQPLAHPMPTTINATADFAIMKELFTHLIEGSVAVGEDLQEIERWEQILEKVPSYQINDDGAIKEWMHDDFEDRYDHRHLSHIYPVFPGQEFTREENPDIFKAFEIAVNNRLIGAQTGWSLVHMSSIYSRLENGDKALESLDVLSRSCLLSNFFTLHNDWRDMGICLNSETAPVQMDANLGFVNAVQEMLIYVSPSFMKLLPALPTKWKQGKVKDIRFMTGKICFSWDKEINKFEGTLIAERETQLILKLPDLCKNYTIIGDAINYRQSKIGKNYVDIKMEPGQTLSIKSSENAYAISDQ